MKWLDCDAQEIRLGDLVQVIAEGARGETGKVIGFDPNSIEGSFVLLEIQRPYVLSSTSYVTPYKKYAYNLKQTLDPDLRVDEGL